VSDLFDQPEATEPAKSAVQQLFVDEAGDPTLFHSSGKPIVDTPGCTRFFMLGKLEVDNPPTLAAKLEKLRKELLADPYFSGVESLKPERKRTALLFHAKDDLPEVRYRVYDLLRAEGQALRFYAVVRDKFALLRQETVKREQNPKYRYHHDSVYDALAHSLFAKFHRLADRYEVCIAKRGAKDRNQALQQALATAEREFESKFGFSRGGPQAWKLTISNPVQTVCLQAADYFLWALQRFYETRRNLETRAELPREDRFLKMLWPQIAEVHDLDLGPAHGTFFNQKHPLTVEGRFPEKPVKKKMS
jgi:hypothetical protein